jgi:hypothetical protein
MSAIATPRAPRSGRRLRNPFRRQSPLDMHPAAKFAAFCLLCGWALVVLLPIYWLAVTSGCAVPVDEAVLVVRRLQPTLDHGFILFFVSSQ